MSYRAIYAYPWDIAETGAPAAIAEFSQLGLDTVTLAGAYHAGKFLRPHGVGGKVYFPDDGTTNFRTEPSRYGAIKPVASKLVAERDIFRELTDTGGMAINAWLVVLHNTRLGMAHPESLVRNAFGDPYIYNLCPSAPEARAYAVGLAMDVTENYPVSGITLEAPGFLVYRHGFHHEFSLLPTNAWLENHLGLCFCNHCITGAEQAGIDAKRLKAHTAAALECYFESGVDLPADMAEAFWEADVVDRGDLRRFLDFRCDVVTSLVAEIRRAVRPDATVAVIPSTSRPCAGAWYEGSNLGALTQAGAIIEGLFYEPSAIRIRADLFDVQRRVGSKGKVRAILRPYHLEGLSKGEFLASVGALRAGGVEELAFYNWGHLRRTQLAWIREALDAVT